MKRHEIVNVNLLTLVAIGTLLVFSSVFLSVTLQKTLTLYYAFVFISAFFLLCLGKHLISKRIRLSFSIPQITSVILSFYILIHSQIGNNESVKVDYYLWSIIYFLALIYLFKQKLIKFELIYSLFFAMAVLQVIVCLCQYMGILESGNEYYKVLGTFNNPSITAMYITLCTPYLLKNIFLKERLLLSTIILLLFSLTLIILNSRTAYAGYIVIFFVFFIKNKKTHSIISTIGIRNKLIFSSLFLICLITVAKISYKDKQTSADGRLFVWKVSIDMISQKPLLGHGFGLFEKEYNLHQSKYIENTTAISAKEKENARYVYMPYNDFLEQTIEGGIIGLVLFCMFIGIILCYTVKQQALVASIVFSIIIMSCVNFSIQAILVWMLFLTTAAYSVSQNEITFKLPLILSKLVGIIIILFSMYSFFKYSNHLHGEILLKKASVNIQEGKIKQAKLLLKCADTKIASNPLYSMTCGRLCITENKIDEAIVRFEDALKYTSNPDLLCNLAKCYTKQKEYAKAEKLLNRAVFMVPSHFRQRMILLQLYTVSEEKQKARLLAEEILSMKYSPNNKDAINARKLASSNLNQIFAK